VDQVKMRRKKMKEFGQIKRWKMIRKTKLMKKKWKA